MSQGIHSCSWFCEVPNCVKAQRDELRERITELRAELVELRESLRAAGPQPEPAVSSTATAGS